MARLFRVKVGEDSSPVLDRTDDIRWPEVEVGMAAENGTVSVGHVPVDDDNAAFSFPAKNRAEWLEGSNVLWRGRIQAVDYSRGERNADRQRLQDVTVDDYNIDLDGIDVNGWARPSETDKARVQGLIASFLSGSPRATTVLNGSNYVSSSNTITLAAKTYSQMTPKDVLTEIVAETNKDFFVDVDGNLHYDGHDSTAFMCPFFITDREDELRANPTTALAIIPDMGPHQSIEGQELSSHVRVYYTPELYKEASNPVTQTNHAYWLTPFFVDGITSAQAQQIANTLAARRAFPGRHYQFTVGNAQGGPLTEAQVGSIKAGQQVRIKARVFSDAQDSFLVRRIVECTWTTPAPGQFYAHLRLDKRLLTQPAVAIGPQPPEPPTAGSCTRLYPDNTTPATVSGTTKDASWEEDSSSGMGTLKTTPDGDYSSTAGVSSSLTGLAGGEDHLYIRWAYQMDSTMAAIIAAGGATIRGQFRTRARFGIGISEGSQDMISQIGVRVTQGTSTTIRGTALALHSLTSSVGSSKWPAQSTLVNHVFPAAAATNVLSSVSGATSGDWLIVEVGSRNFTTVTSGGRVGLMTQGTEDLPENDTETDSSLNCWIEICSGSSGGSTPEPIGDTGSGSSGSGGTYAPLNHVHEHGLLSTSETRYHDAVDIEYDPTTSGLDAVNVQEALDEIVATGGGGVSVLDDLTDVTITSVADGDVLTYDSGSGDWVNGAASGGSTSFVSIAKWGND